MNMGQTTFNQSFSCRGGLVLPVDLDFISSQNTVIDLTADIQQGRMDFIQSVYIDMTDYAAADLTIFGNVGKHRVFCEGGFILYSPIMVTDTPQFTASISAPINSTITVLFSNIPFFPFYQQVI